MEEQQAKPPEQPSAAPTSYDLEVDRQVEKYLDLKHSLTLFLITAAIGSMGFTLNFAVQHLDIITNHIERIMFLSLGSILSLVTAALLFYALDLDMVSFRHHLDMRYQHKSFEQLPPHQQWTWNRDISRAKASRRWALVLLFTSIFFQAMLLLSFVLY